MRSRRGASAAGTRRAVVCRRAGSRDVAPSRFNTVIAPRIRTATFCTRRIALIKLLRLCRTR